jgi:hypothetical protein
MTQIKLKKPNKIRNLGTKFFKKINKKNKKITIKKEPQWDKKNIIN